MLYKKYKDKVKDLAEIKKLYTRFCMKVLCKIPWGLLKEKRKVIAGDQGLYDHPPTHQHGGHQSSFKPSGRCAGLGFKNSPTPVSRLANPKMGF